MAIRKDNELSTDKEVVVRIDNGDLEALRRLEQLWKLRDEEATLTFAVGILRLAEHNRRVLIEPAGTDKPVPVNPGEQLLKREGGEAKVE